MGRGSSPTEQHGFGITDPDDTKRMVDEVLPAVQADVGRERVPLRRRVLLDAAAQRAAEAAAGPAPADVDRGREPGHVREGGPAGARRAVLHHGLARDAGAARGDLQEGDRERRAGRRVRERQRHGHEPDAVSRGRAEGARHRRQHDQRLPEQSRVPLPRHVPHAAGHARVARAHPRADAAGPRRAHRGRARVHGHARRGRRSRCRRTPTSAPTSSCSACCRRRCRWRSRSRRSRPSAST